MKTTPKKIGKNSALQDPKTGKFLPGNPGGGRPPGSGLSITTEVKRKLEQVPEGQKATYLELLINRIFKQAIQDGDQQMIKQIWNYVDGLPRQKIDADLTSGGKPIMGGSADVPKDESVRQDSEAE